MLKTVVITIVGISPYSQSKAYEVDKLQGEGFEDYEKRTWRNRMHFDDKGMVFIPPMAFKNLLAEGAKFLSIPIPGKGKATYTKHFEAGILTVNPPQLGVHKDSVGWERLFVPADGRRGSGKRVYKYFPFFPVGWKVDVEFVILDDTVLQTYVDGRTVFQNVIERCGQYIGIGRFRPRNNGFYGRFEITDFAIIEDDIARAA
jgi:hypothetical protein